MRLVSMQHTFKTENQTCIWSQAGVVESKVCRKNYNCSDCRFDRVMAQAAEENKKLTQIGKAPRGQQGQIISWKDKLRKRPVWKQPCIHHMKGRIEFRSCNNDYNCVKCEFDQFLQDQFSVHAVVTPVGVLDVRGFKIPQGYYFHPRHTWVKLEQGSLVRVGIDAFALGLLGPLDKIEAPLMGKEVTQGKENILATRGEYNAKLLSPVTGTVEAVNTKLLEQGDIANNDPYADGWVMTVHAENLREDLRNLSIGEESAGILKREIDRLYDVIEEVSGPLAADGGNLTSDIFGNMPQLGWERLSRLFLAEQDV